MLQPEKRRVGWNHQRRFAGEEDWDAQSAERIVASSGVASGGFLTAGTKTTAVMPFVENRGAEALAVA